MNEYTENGNRQHCGGGGGGMGLSKFRRYYEFWVHTPFTLRCVPLSFSVRSQFKWGGNENFSRDIILLLNVISFPTVCQPPSTLFHAVFLKVSFLSINF